MLMLGHSASRQVIDGTFALEKSSAAHALLKNRPQIMQAAARMGMPVPSAYRDYQPLVSGLRAGRAARQLGYPVVVKTATRGNPGGTILDIRDSSALDEAVKIASGIEQQFIVEDFVPGGTYKLLLAGHELVAVLSSPAHGEIPVEFDGDVHESTRNMAISASRDLDVGLLIVTIVTPDISVELLSGAGAVTGMDVAPRLDRLLEPGSPLMARAADGFVRWLVPSGADSRLPVISVTGTNGKTTTSRMIAHIMQGTGLVTGLQCTDGRYINGRLVHAGDDSALTGHFCFYEDQTAQLAVLESHHVGLATTGFAFNWCDVAVCTNVSDDHMNELGVETVSDMAVLKRSLIERARGTAVLNADDPHCLAMIPIVTAQRTCLTSIHKTPDELAALVDGDSCCCVLEHQRGQQWIVVYESGVRTAIIPASEIPATFGGLAQFNVQNAMQAIAAAYAMDADPAVIRSALSSFEMSKENTPNRLNFYSGLPFRVLMDFAHNPDGLRRLAEFTDAMEIAGQRILVFSGTRSRDHIRRVSKVAAGHFDHFIVTASSGAEYRTKDDWPQDTPAFVASALQECGVAQSSIGLVVPEMEAIEHALDMAAPGDLVVLLLRSVGRKLIEGFMRDYTGRRT
jgi:cyanophycin synthetase